MASNRLLEGLSWPYPRGNWAGQAWRSAGVAAAGLLAGLDTVALSPSGVWRHREDNRHHRAGARVRLRPVWAGVPGVPLGTAVAGQAGTGRAVAHHRRAGLRGVPDPDRD